MKVLVTGGDGQLSSVLKEKVNGLNNDYFVFVGKRELDITNKQQVFDFFNGQNFLFCINSAAYTAVDKAEKEQDLAMKVNSDGAKNIAQACKEFDVTLIHISTDFVFDGSGNMPFTELSKPNPINMYGTSKLSGELEIIKTLKKYYIVRTSWLYSEFGNNFLKTMLRLGKERETISVVNDQIGTPTYAGDLADIILNFIKIKKPHTYGTYHYSNEGSCSWYEFATTIFEINEIAVFVLPIPSSEYPTLAERPSYSVLDKTKIKTAAQIYIPKWEDSLSRTLERLSG